MNLKQLKPSKASMNNATSFHILLVCGISLSIHTVNFSKCYKNYIAYTLPMVEFTKSSEQR